MNSGDSITVEIDSLFYTNGNQVNRGGDIFIGVNTKPIIDLNNPTKLIYQMQTGGRPMGNALANGMGGSTQNFYWYLGGKFRYTWVKP